MPVQGIWQNNRIGDPAYLGFTLGGVLEYTSSGSFVKADYPGLRAIRQDDDEPILAVDLAASTTITPATEADGPRGTLGYAEVTSNQGSLTNTMTDLTGLSTTVTVAADRRLRIIGFAFAWSGWTVGDEMDFLIREGSTTLSRSRMRAFATGGNSAIPAPIAVLTPSAGSHTYKLSFQRITGTGGTYTLLAASTNPAFILVEDITATMTRSIVELWY